MNNRKKSFVQLLLWLGGLLLLNVFFNWLPFSPQLDVTSDKRFSLTAATKQMVRKLNSDVSVEVYLEGEFPSGFKRLQTGIRNLLNDMRSQSSRFRYSFIDPLAGDIPTRNAAMEGFKKDKIFPINLKVKSKEGMQEKMLFPYAKVYYKGRWAIVNLLENQVQGLSQEVILNNSLSLVEYKIANAINKLSATAAPLIGFIEGHGELAPIETADLEQTLREFYSTVHINLDSATQLKQGIGALVIARPRTSFPLKHQFLIDQYIMNGGKVVWCIDKLAVATDSLRRSKEFVPTDYTLDIDNLLFRYGARINPNTVMDMRCSRIPLQVGVMGNEPQYDLKPWYYHVLAFSEGNHPIVKNLDAIQLYYPSSIDTIKTKTPVTKTVVLASSDHSSMRFLPFRVSFDILRTAPDPVQFNKPKQAMAVLLEGTFPSYFENRVTPEFEAALGKTGQKFKAVSEKTKQVVIADGDICRNDVSPELNDFKPLGYNNFEKHQFANKKFMLNVIEYLLDNNGVMEARSKEVKLRLLDKPAVEANKLLYQIVNTAAPLLLLGIFAFFFNRWRKRKYA